MPVCGSGCAPEVGGMPGQERASVETAAASGAAEVGEIAGWRGNALCAGDRYAL